MKILPVDMLSTTQFYFLPYIMDFAAKNIKANAKVISYG